MKTFESPLSTSVKWITIVVLVMLIWAITSLSRSLDGSILSMVAVVDLGVT